MQEKPPEGSKIQYTRSVDSIQYSWEPQELKPLRYFFVGFLALFLVLSMVFGVMYVIQELSAETSFHLRLFLIVFLFMFTMIFSAFSVVLYFLIRPSKPVIITLSSELFEYQTGYCSSEMMPLARAALSSSQ